MTTRPLRRLSSDATPEKHARGPGRPGRRQLVGRQRPAEKEALRVAAVFRPQERKQLQGLDTLGGCGDLMDERLIDLEDVDRELPQVSHARVAGPEIVDRDRDTERSQRLQHLHG